MKCISAQPSHVLLCLPHPNTRHLPTPIWPYISIPPYGSISAPDLGTHGIFQLSMSWSTVLCERGWRPPSGFNDSVYLPDLFSVLRLLFSASLLGRAGMHACIVLQSYYHEI